MNLFLVLGLAWLAVMLAVLIKASWHDEFGRPWYHPWTIRGRHRQADRRRMGLMVGGRRVAYDHWG